MKTWRCWFRHLWRVHQVGMLGHSNNEEFVLAWKQCERCAKSKLIHILI